MLSGVCPGCGLRADLEVFALQAGASAALCAALALPPALGERVMRYLRLFNPPQKVLSQAKTIRLLTELADAVAAAQVRRHGIDRAAPLPLWQAALDAVLAQPPERLPLDGHGYLFAVAWNLAEKAAARQERQDEDRVRHRLPPAPADGRAADVSPLFQKQGADAQQGADAPRSPSPASERRARNAVAARELVQNIARSRGIHLPSSPAPLPEGEGDAPASPPQSPTPTPTP